MAGYSDAKAMPAFLRLSNRTPKAMTFNEIDAAVRSLNHDELVKLRQRINSLLMVSGDSGEKATAATDQYAVWMLDSICERMHAINGSSPNALVLRKRDGWSAYADKCKRLAAWMNTAGLSRQQQHSLFKLGVDLLYENLRNMHTTPVGATTIMAHIHRMPDVVDQAFPGYHASKALNLIFRSRA